MLGCHCGPLFSSSTSPPNAQPHLHPSTLPFSFPKQTGNPGICAPAWLPSWLRGHHRTSAPSPHEAKNLCVPSAHGTDKQARNDDGKSSFSVGQEQQRELERALGLAWRGRRTWGVPAISSTTPETQAAHSSQDHNKVQEAGRGLDGALHSPIFNY